MAWTFKWGTSQQVLYGDSVQYGSNIVWLDVNYKIIEFDGTVETEILDAPTDITDFYSGGHPVVATLDGVLIFVCVIQDSSSNFHVKAFVYSGTPHSWANTLTISTTDTTTHDVSVVLHKNIRLAFDFYSTYTTGTTFEHRSTVDGSTWSVDSGITSPADGSVQAAQCAGNENKFIKYVYNRTSSTHEIWGYDSASGTWSFLYGLSGAGISYRVSPVYPAGNSIPYMVALRDSDYAVMVSDDGSTWTATSLSVSSGTAPEIFAAGYREFIVNSGNLYYLDDTGTWQLIEAPPAAYVFAVVNFGGKLWVQADSSGSGSGAWYEHSSFSDWGTYSSGSPEPSMRLLDFATALWGGDYLWTCILYDGTLKIQKRDITKITVSAEIAIGAATNAEIDAGTYELHVSDYDNSSIFAFGRYNHFSHGITHVMHSTDGGGTWAVVGGTNWAADKCASLNVDSSGTAYAIRTSATAPPKLYKITSVATYKVTIPMPAGTQIKSKSVVLAFDGTMYVAGIKPSGDVIVLHSDTSKLSWTDITNSLGMTGINALVSLE